MQSTRASIRTKFDGNLELFNNILEHLNNANPDEQIPWFQTKLFIALGCRAIPVQSHEESNLLPWSQLELIIGMGIELANQNGDNEVLPSKEKFKKLFLAIKEYELKLLAYKFRLKASDADEIKNKEENLSILDTYLDKIKNFMILNFGIAAYFKERTFQNLFDNYIHKEPDYELMTFTYGLLCALDVFLRNNQDVNENIQTLELINGLTHDTASFEFKNNNLYVLYESEGKIEEKTLSEVKELCLGSVKNSTRITLDSPALLTIRAQLKTAEILKTIIKPECITEESQRILNLLTKRDDNDKIIALSLKSKTNLFSFDAAKSKGNTLTPVQSSLLEGFRKR